MKDLHHIDHQVEQKMNAWRPEPPAYVHDQVMAAVLHNTKPKPTLFPWWTIATLVCVAAAGTWYLAHYRSVQSLAPATIRSQESANSYQSAADAPAPAISVAAAAPLDAKNAASALAVPTSAAASVQPAKVKTNGKIVFGSRNPQDTKATNSAQPKGSQVVAGENGIAQSNQSTEVGALIASATTINQQGETTGHSTGGQGHPLLSETQSNAQLAAYAAAGMSAAVSGKAVFEGQDASKMESRHAALTFLPQHTESVMTTITKAKTKLPRCTTKPRVLSRSERLTRYADAGKYRNLHFLEAYAGTRYAQTLLKSTAIEHNDYLQQRRNTERADLGWELGVRGDYVFNRFWVVQAGVQLAQNTAVFHFDDTQVVQKSPVAGTTDSVYMTGLVQFKKVYNRSHTLDLPIAAGIELRKGLKGLRFTTGAEINIGTRARGGMMFDTTGQRITYTSADAATIYRSNIGVRGFATAQMFRSFNGRDRLFVEGQLTYQPWSSTRRDGPIEQRYGIGSLRVGYAVGL
jgi:hypothetical protein